MKNSPEMKKMIASTARYLLSLSKEELNRRIDSCQDGEISQLFLDAGFLEREDWSENNFNLQNEDQIKYINDNSKINFFDWSSTQKFSSIDWSRKYIERLTTSQPLHFQEMFFVPKTIYDYLIQHEDERDYLFEKPTSCLKIA